MITISNLDFYFKTTIVRWVYLGIGQIIQNMNLLKVSESSKVPELLKSSLFYSGVVDDDRQKKKTG